MKIKNVLEKKETNIINNKDNISPDKIEFIGKFIEETNILMSCCQIDLETPIEYDINELKCKRKPSRSRSYKVIKSRKKIRSSKKIDKNTCYKSIHNNIIKHKYGAISPSACNGIG